jgi:SAM-dependent methyltransferase
MNRTSLEPHADRCPACEGRALKHFTAYAHDAGPGQALTVNVVECQSCDWGWQFPLARDVGGSNAVFDDAYRTAAADSYFDPNKRKSVAQLQRDFLVQRFAPRSLLDIGCGDGAFAAEMAGVGCVTVGLDPSLPEDRVSQLTATDPEAKLTLLRGGLEALDTHSRFDIVTLWDVIEHVPEPIGLIRAAVDRLSPGGWILVETGNYQSQARVESANRWWGYQLDHRWYFAPPQLRELLRTCGLGSIELVDRVLRPWWMGKPGAAAPGRRALLSKALRRPHRALSLWEQHVALTRAAHQWPTWSGLEIMTFVARRHA